MEQSSQKLQPIKDDRFKMLTIFGSTYVCKQTFSNINFIKNKLRNQLNDISLVDTCLKWKSIDYSLEFNKLCSEI